MSQPYIVMGANGGIGGNLARRLLDGGADVIVTARDTATLDGLAGHDNATLCRVDVNNPDDIAAMVDAADTGEGIAGLAYCIGSIDLKPFRSANDADFATAFDLNVTGAVRALRAAQKGLRKAGGSVVLFSSIAASQGFPNHTVIGSAKGAVEGFVRSLAAEWAPHVRVNCVAPSLTDTALAAPLTGSAKMAESIAAMHPVPRLGKPEDSAAVAEFLLGPASGWITGQVINVDGGRSTLRIRA